jgi:hypothetical protein
MKTENVTLCGTYTTSIGEIGVTLLHIHIGYNPFYENSRNNTLRFIRYCR